MLTNLQMDLFQALLKAAAVRQLVPGLEVRGGEVGLLQLSLPPASLGSDPLVLVIEDVNIVLGPSRSPRTVAENMVRLNVSIIDVLRRLFSRQRQNQLRTTVMISEQILGLGCTPSSPAG